MKKLLTSLLLVQSFSNTFAYSKLDECLNVNQEDKTRIFKILREVEWTQFKWDGHFSGSVHDRRDGFIHMATLDKLEYVISKYFSDTPIHIVEFSEDLYQDSIRWENGFPHIYGDSLRIEDIVNVYRCIEE